MIKNIIFDWSGVLSDDIVPVYKATMNVFRKLGIKALTLEEFRKEFTSPYMIFYKKFTNATQEKLKKLYIKEIHSVGEPKAFPRVKEILEFLHRKGMKLAILTSIPETKLEKELDGYGFRKFFVDASGGLHDKTEAIVKVMERNGFAPEETAYVGDMTHDIDVGKKAGVTTIAVLGGYQTKEQLRREKPDFIIEKLGEIKKIIFDE